MKEQFEVTTWKFTYAIWDNKDHVFLTEYCMPKTFPTIEDAQAKADKLNASVPARIWKENHKKYI